MRWCYRKVIEYSNGQSRESIDNIIGETRVNTSARPSSTHPKYRSRNYRILIYAPYSMYIQYTQTIVLLQHVLNMPVIRVCGTCICFEALQSSTTVRAVRVLST
jgi:hypothetical protein